MVFPAACVPTAGVAAAKVGGGMSLFKMWASIVACMKGSTSYCAHHSNCCAPCYGAVGSGATTCSSCLSGTCDICAGFCDACLRQPPHCSGCENCCNNSSATSTRSSRSRTTEGYSTTFQPSSSMHRRNGYSLNDGFSFDEGRDESLLEYLTGPMDR